MLGIAQPMKLEIARIKCGLNPVSRKQSCGADASGTLRRSRFGMRSGLPLLAMKSGCASRQGLIWKTEPWSGQLNPYSIIAPYALSMTKRKRPG